MGILARRSVVGQECPTCVLGLTMICPLIKFIAIFLTCVGVSSNVMADSPLADAAEAHDTAHVDVLLEQDVDVNAAQVDDMTALHWAVRHDDIAMTQKLIDAKANVDAENRYEIRPLSIACTNGNPAIVDALLAAGANPNSTLSGGETVLMTAARTGRIEPVKSLIAAGADVNAKERKSQTALMWAAADGHADVVRVLIEARADFRTPLKSGFTPLCFAVREGQIEVVKVLLAAGVDINEAMEPDKVSGRSPAKGTSPLILAIENGHFDLAVLLLESGADPNDQRSGFTPLHTMSWVRKPNRGDGIDGEPAPQGTGRLTSLQFVEKLVAHGADVNAQLKKGEGGKGKLNRTGATPFLLAADTADAPLMRLLVKLGADPHRANETGSTPLMAAAGFGTAAPGEEAGTEPELLEAVQYLLGLGADVNAVDKNGETAMHGAAYKNAPAVVKLLADNGAKASVWDKPNKHGWTPLKIAEGHRPGNFRPSPDTLAALKAALGE